MIKPEQNSEATLKIVGRSKLIYGNILSPLSFLGQRCLSLIRSDRYLSKCEEKNAKEHR